jgi:hypothetical protein
VNENGTVTVAVAFLDTEASEATVTVEFEPVKVTSNTGSLADIRLVKGGDPVTLTVSSVFALGSVRWTVDGNPTARTTKNGVSGLGGITLTLNPADYGIREKPHTVTVTAKVDNKQLYSVTVPFTVTAGTN